MSYTLDNAVTDLKESVHWLTQRVIKQPIEGLVDGTNKLFLLPHAPASTGTLTLYEVDGTAIASADYTVDVDTGEITMDTAPTDTTYSTYTAEAFTSTELTDVVEGGFAKMQAVYPRSWFLFTSGATTYISTSSTADTEPVVGGQALSDNVVQIQFYMMCCRFSLNQMLYEEYALQDHQFRESGRVGGMLVDMRQRPENILAVLERLDKMIDSSAASAASNAGDTDTFGDFIPGARSDEHYYGYDWWRDGLQDSGEID